MDFVSTWALLEINFFPGNADFLHMYANIKLDIIFR